MRKPVEYFAQGYTSRVVVKRMWKTLRPYLELGYQWEEEEGVPVLDIDRQADKIDLPIKINNYGAKLPCDLGTMLNIDTERSAEILSGYLRGIKHEAVTASEYNIDLSDTVPDAVALSHVYLKRWIGRYWQSQGVRLIADVSQGEKHFELGLRGIPKGWASYLLYLRGNWSFERVLERYERVKAHADVTDGEILWVIVGGRKEVVEPALKMGWVYIPFNLNFNKHRNLFIGSEKVTNRRERYPTDI